MAPKFDPSGECVWLMLHRLSCYAVIRLQTTSQAISHCASCAEQDNSLARTVCLSESAFCCMHISSRPAQLGCGVLHTADPAPPACSRR